MKKIQISLLAVATILGAMNTASAYTLSNSGAGDGFVTAIAGGFDLFGSDNDTGFNNTFYTDVAAINETLNFNYTYTTNDCCGSFYDPAGYVINGVQTQLSPASSPIGFSGSGTVQLALLAGDTFGFYVNTTDGVQGRADIAVTDGGAPSPVPLPAALPLLGAAMGGFGVTGFLRRKTSV